MIDIQGQLDPLFEIMGLLYVSCNLDAVKQEMKAGLSDFGLEAEAFYAQNLTIFDEYVQAFMNNREGSPEDLAFFKGKDFTCFAILLSLLIENRNWFTSTEGLTNEEIKAQLIHACHEMFDDITEPPNPESLEDIIGLLEAIGLEDNSKWLLLLMMQQPKKHVARLVDIVNANAKAYEKALSSVSKPLGRLMQQYDQWMRNQDDQTFFELKHKMAGATAIHPTLVYPISQIILESGCYYGLLCAKALSKEKSLVQEKELLLMKLKALSDRSKLEILTSLKVSPKYNLEIAQQLGLTAATMSHHMGVLLTCGFVGIEKKDGKVYYHLEKDNLRDMISVLEKILL